MSFYVNFRGKEVLEKLILVLEKSLNEKSLIFAPKLLYEPWFWRGSCAMPPADSAPVKKRFCVCLMYFVDCYQGSFKVYNGELHIIVCLREACSWSSDFHDSTKRSEQKTQQDFILHSPIWTPETCRPVIVLKSLQEYDWYKNQSKRWH